MTPHHTRPHAPATGSSPLLADSPETHGTHGVHGGALPAIALEFTDRLRHLPLGAWADAAGAAPPADAHDQAPAAAARARLRVIADDMPSVVIQLRARVNNVVGAAEGFVHQSAVGRMKKTALTAGLALVARPALGEEDFARLYAPFADLIPARELDAPAAGLSFGAPSPPAAAG